MSENVRRYCLLLESQVNLVGLLAIYREDLPSIWDASIRLWGGMSPGEKDLCHAYYKHQRERLS